MITMSPVQASQDGTSVVQSFIKSAESALDRPMGERVSLLGGVYRTHFDMRVIADQVLSKAHWQIVNASQKVRITNKLACLLATETAKRPSSDRLSSWRVIGSRDSGEKTTIAVRFQRAKGSVETVLFDLLSTRRGPRIVDMRSGHGRMSLLLAERVAREQARLARDDRLEKWLKGTPCGE